MPPSCTIAILNHCVCFLLEGTKQGDPVVMAVYTIATISLILLILEITDNCPHEISKAAAYADDLTEARIVKISSIGGSTCAS